jgi:hypothetical protein
MLGPIRRRAASAAASPPRGVRAMSSNPTISELTDAAIQKAIRPISSTPSVRNSLRST